MSNTLVLQSHCKPLPAEWMQECLNSVQNWSELNTFDYKFIGDELFEYVPDSILEKTKVQRVIATDLARLKAIKSYLVDGYETVVWCDADFLIFSPEKFLLPKDKYAVGREVWVQAVEEKSKKLSAHVKVHNAFMMYRTGNTFLEFYIDTAERLLINNIGRMSPQFIGPKLLTAIHNVAHVAKGGGAALELFLKKSSETIYAANLCNSLFERKEYSANVIEKCVTTLISGKGISV
jgi:hypothetical protein